jgi:DNA polymerase-1
MVKFKDVLGKKFKSFDQVSVADAAEYGAHDALQTLKLYKVLQPKLHAEKKLEAFFYDVEMPFYKTLLKMEYTGIGIDITKIKEIAKKVDKELPAIVAKITAASGNEQEPINLNSPRQIETLLFDTLGLPVGKKSAKGKRSTDQEVLEQLSSIHPIPALIVKHRELSKLKNTYLDPLPTFVSPLTGRIHTSYSQTMVATGRLSSSNPNLQNIPTSAGYGLAIREAFEASPGKIFLSADYAQVELRILANFSGDKNLTDAFLNGIDVHTQTAAQIFDIPLDTVTHEQRQLGKRINFSIIYGLTPYGLSQDLKISATTAKAYIEKYFQTYPKVATWMETIVEKAKECGYVETALGRRRYLPQIRERNKNLFEAARRMAINTPVQGTQAEIMKLAMMQIDTAFEDKGLDAKLILQIHDELLIEVRKDDLQDIQRLVQSKMEHIVDWNVPLKVTMRAGNNWGEVTK